MAEGFDKNILDPSEKNKEGEDNNKDILDWFKDNLQHLAQDIYHEYKDKLDNALQSLKNWLSLQEQKVQKDTINELSQLRSSIEKVIISNNSVSWEIPLSWSTFDRSEQAQKGIRQSYQHIDAMIQSSPNDTNPIAAVVGRLMKKIIETET